MSKLVRMMDVSLGALSNLEPAKGFKNFTVCKKDRANKGFLENCIETVLKFFCKKI